MAVCHFTYRRSAVVTEAQWHKHRGIHYLLTTLLVPGGLAVLELVHIAANGQTELTSEHQRYERVTL